MHLAALTAFWGELFTLDGFFAIVHRSKSLLRSCGGRGVISVPSLASFEKVLILSKLLSSKQQKQIIHINDPHPKQILFLINNFCTSLKKDYRKKLVHHVVSIFISQKKNLYLSLNHKNAPQCFQEARNSHFPGPKRISVSPDATTETATGFSNPLWAHCWPELFARSPVRGCSRLAVGGGRK